MKKIDDLKELIKDWIGIVLAIAGMIIVAVCVGILLFKVHPIVGFIYIGGLSIGLGCFLMENYY